MLVTVLITNYNYEQFLTDAIESALAQTHQEVEVVVVDDGSTDNSREVIARYGDRIVRLLQPNAGQASATNAGIARARGEVVCLLDADDVYAPEKVERVLAAYRPDASVIYHQLQMVDVEGMPIGRPYPRSVFGGDIAARVVSAGGYWPWPVASGLAFPRRFLERVVPVPSRMFPDPYLAGLAPFYGAVVGIAEPLAKNRVHGANTWTTPRAGSTSNDEAARRRHDRLLAEWSTVRDVLARERADVVLSAENNLAIERSRWITGDGVSRGRATAATIRCPTLPWPMRWREVVRLNLRAS